MTRYPLACIITRHRAPPTPRRTPPVSLATPAELESAKQFLTMLPKASGGKSFLSLEELRAFDEIKVSE